MNQSITKSKLRSALALTPLALTPLALIPLALLTQSASAHMPWLACDEQGQAVLWFGETPDDRTYTMPDSVAGIELVQIVGEKPTTVSLTAVDSDALVGMRSDKALERSGELTGTVTYGLYHGMKLTYHVEHLPQTEPTAWPTEPRGDAVLQSVITPAADGGVSVRVLHHGQPVSDTEVKLFCEDGHEEDSQLTDSDGRVQFAAAVVESGLNAIQVGVRQSDQSGRWDGKPYGSTADYLTATFVKSNAKSPSSDKMTKPEPAGPTVDPDSGASIVPSKLSELPEELTSFGAAIAGGKLWVYGGHTGSAHSYSTEEQSDRLWCLDLQSDNATWVEAARGPRLQGLALVAHGDQLIRVGGFTAMNEADEEQDLRSQTSVSRFDPASGQWTDLASLPEPRSSLDAAVLGDVLYVVGGWNLAGASDGSTWHETAWSLDLTDANATWQAIAKPPFQRRALSVAAHGGKVYAIGGMQEVGGPTTRVDVYDPAADTWSEAASLPGSGMSGFGSAAFACGDDLVVSTMDGFVHRLGDASDRWQTIAEFDEARFFHRMLPIGQSELVMVGGANMEIGKFVDLPIIQLGETTSGDTP